MDAVIRRCWAVFLLFIIAPAWADIALLVPEQNAQALSLKHELQAQISEFAPEDTVRLAKAGTPAADAILNSNDLNFIIVVSARTLEQAVAHRRFPEGVPVVGIYLSRHDYLTYQDTLDSAIFVEPPIDRQVALARQVFGKNESFGVLVNSVSDLRTTEKGLTLYPIDQYDSLNHALVRLLGENQALIGVYDQSLYSAENIKSILITSYRHNRALIGPSHAYLRAGALATTYSSASDIVRRLSELIRSSFSPEEELPKAGYNPYFRVGFNDQVGRSLNLLLPEPEATAQNIKDELSRVGREQK